MNTLNPYFAAKWQAKRNQQDRVISHKDYIAYPSNRANWALALNLARWIGNEMAFYNGLTWGVRAGHAESDYKDKLARRANGARYEAQARGIIC